MQYAYAINKTRRYGSVYLGVVELSVCEVCYVNEGYVGSAVIFKNLFMLSVRISSYECTREGWRARKMRKSCTRR